jgi:glucose dehydrogenase
MVMAGAVATGWPADRSAGARAGDVTDARVVAEAPRGRNWLVLGGNFGSRHYSPLRQIEAGNVKRLGLAWVLDIDSPMGLATEPIVVDGTIYATASLDRVYAVDSASGRLLWQFDPHVRPSVMRNSWAARTNRGAAVYRGRVYFGTGDCRLIALEASTGRELWSSPVCVDATQTGITGAPTVGDGKVYIGYSCIVALKADTGEYAWHYQTSIDSENFHVLVTDLMIGGAKRHVVMTVPRNGTFFLLDARTGKLIAKKDLATAHAQEPLASAADAALRPRSGHNWWPMSYDPLTRLVYIPTYDDVAHPTGYQNQATGRLIAWDPVAESARWTVPQQLSTNREASGWPEMNPAA